MPAACTLHATDHPSACSPTLYPLPDCWLETPIHSRANSHAKTHERRVCLALRRPALGFEPWIVMSVCELPDMRVSLEALGPAALYSHVVPATSRQSPVAESKALVYTCASCPGSPSGLWLHSAIDSQGA